MFKIIVAITAIICTLKINAQNKTMDYTKWWYEIDSLVVVENKTKSAIQKVNALLQKAKQQNNSNQVAKAYLYKISLEEHITEANNESADILKIEKEIANTNSVTLTSILKLYTLRKYINYFANNRWNLPENTTSVKNKTIEQLSKEELLDTINYKALQIFNDEATLWKTSTNQFNAIINFGSNKTLRCTLYELLAYEVIEALNFLNDDGNIENQFHITNDTAVSSIPTFLKLKLNLNNISHTSLWLLQNIIKHHLNDKIFTQLIDADLYRINHATKVYTKNQDAPLQAIDYLINTYKTTDEVVWAVLAKTKLLIDQGNNYTTNANFRYKKQEAYQVIIDYLQNNKRIDSNSYKQLLVLKKQIEAKYLTAKVEAVNIANTPFRMLVNFKNTTHLHYRLIKLENTLKAEEQYFDINNELQWLKLNSFTKIAASEIKLPLNNDFQQHSTEIKLDGLPSGKYALIGASSNKFSFADDACFYLPFAVSNIAYIQNNFDLFVVHRNTGLPISNAQVKVFTSIYDYKNSKQDYKLVQTITSDKNGHCKIEPNNKQQANNFFLIIKTNDETLVCNNNINVYESLNSNQKSINECNIEYAKVHFFTDRSIYRPQQSVFFKGLVLTKDSQYDTYKIYNTFKFVKVELIDANYTIVDTQSIVVNNFGSFNGSFKLPKNLLTGNFHIRANGIDGQSFFKVEEYKRPTFTVNFNKENLTYEFYKSITIKGLAKSFAGNNINNAKLSFVVKRTQQNNNDWWSYRIYNLQSKPMQIAAGNGFTKDDGNFEISFVALPDETINKKVNPIFNYTIDVKVTDNKGETREATYTLKIGYNNTIINIDAADEMDISKLQKINISTTNLQDILVTKNVEINWQTLQTEQRLIRKRLWEMPDTFIMDKQTYISNFPNDEYSNEANPLNWQTNQTIATQTLKTSEKASENNIHVPNQVQGNSFYKITAILKKDDGSIISTSKIIEITKNNYNIKPSYQNLIDGLENYNVSDTINLSFNSYLTNLFVIKNTVTPNYKALQKNTSNNFEFITSNINGQYNLLHNFKIENENGFGVFYAFVHHNRFFTNGKNIELTSPENNLDITYNSFRNKTLPGSKETYSITIKGKQNDKVELVSSMYDASLDEFYSHQWDKPFVKGDKINIDNRFNAPSFGATIDAVEKYNFNEEAIENLFYYNSLIKNFDEYHNSDGTTFFNAFAKKDQKFKASFNFGTFDEGVTVSANHKPALQKLESVKFSLPKLVDGVKVDGENDKAENNNDLKSVNQNSNSNQSFYTRKNFNETAFFLPNVYANDSGIYSFTVTLPEALTTWKWQNFAHTSNLAMGLSTQTVITQKTLMVQPNTPRFLTQGDVIELAATIANTSDTELTGTCNLQLFNAVTNTPIDGWLNNIFPSQYFTVKANSTVVVKFPIVVPHNFLDAITYKIIAQTNTTNKELAYSDGEENTIPVLSNKLYLSNTLPLFLKPDEQEKTLNYPFLQHALEQQNNIQAQSVTIEYTPNTIFTVIKALPYLVEYPYECAEQTFNRFFAYSIASKIIHQNKTVQQALISWKNNDTNSLHSNLAINSELKQILLHETPWVQDANLQTQQLKHIAILLDDKNIEIKLQETIKKLQELQLPNGGFGWFKGGSENIYITQYILTGLGKLIKYNVLDNQTLKLANNIINNALPLLDKVAAKQYKQYFKQIKKQKIIIAPIDIQYWYMRSFFASQQSKTFPTEYSSFIFNHFSKQWKKLGIQQQAMLSIALQNNVFSKTSTYSLVKKINESLLENTIEDTIHDVLYFKSTPYSCYWHENNFEAQTLVIEALESSMQNAVYVSKLKNWFLVNKQTNHWESTVATANACMALLDKQPKLMEFDDVAIQIGNQTVSTKNNPFGTTKVTYKERDLLQVNNNIKISKFTNKNQQSSYGAVYVQYFQPISDVTESENPYIKITKKIFIKKNINNKEFLQEVNENETVNIGDELIVQLYISAKKDLEFVHLKDLRAAGTEPKNILSEYKWQNGLSYYLATKDASTNFFMDYLPKGNFTLQYSLNITHAGSFNTGIASIQCMYAPSFNANSAGAVLKVE